MIGFGFSQFLAAILLSCSSLTEALCGETGLVSHRRPTSQATKTGPWDKPRQGQWDKPPKRF